MKWICSNRGYTKAYRPISDIYKLHSYCVRNHRPPDATDIASVTMGEYIMIA